MWGYQYCLIDVFPDMFIDRDESIIQIIASSVNIEDNINLNFFCVKGKYYGTEEYLIINNWLLLGLGSSYKSRLLNLSPTTKLKM